MTPYEVVHHLSIFLTYLGNWTMRKLIGVWKRRNRWLQRWSMIYKKLKTEWRYKLISTELKGFFKLGIGYGSSYNPTSRAQLKLGVIISCHKNFMAHIPHWLQGSNPQSKTPEAILDRRFIKVNNATQTQFLVKWVGLPQEDAQWIPAEDFNLHSFFSCINLRTSFLEGGSIDIVT